MSNMWKRIIVGIIGIPIVVGLVYLGGPAFSIFIAVISVLAAREYLQLTDGKNADADRTTSFVWLLALQTTMFGYTAASGLSALNWIGGFVAVLLVGVLLVHAVELFRNKANAVLNTSVTVSGTLYIGLGLGSLIVLRGLEDGFVVTIATLAAVWACDSAAYFVGLAIGKHKLFPRVSPKKSWEGAVGGFVASIGAFAAIVVTWSDRFSLGHALAIGVVIGIVGQIGDLAESLLKRDAAIKDSSTIIPGHGGVLDRMDSLLFVGPAVWVYHFLAFVVFVD